VGGKALSGHAAEQAAEDARRQLVAQAKGDLREIVRDTLCDLQAA
jgi:hypothetical protein